MFTVAAVAGAVTANAVLFHSCASVLATAAAVAALAVAAVAALACSCCTTANNAAFPEGNLFMSSLRLFALTNVINATATVASTLAYDAARAVPRGKPVCCSK
jgi:hypothetical protein